MDGRRSLIVENLRRLRAGRVDTFAQRLRNQKIHYLLQEAGLSPHVPYNLYLRGPYSPELSRITHETPKNEPIKGFALHTLELRFKAVRAFIETLDNRDLELLTTFHWLIEYAELEQNDAIEHLKQLKGASPSELDSVLKRLEEFNHATA